MKVVLKPGLDWKRDFTWGRPDSVPTVLCSGCSAVLPEDDVPFILFDDKGWTLRLCDACLRGKFEFVAEKSK